MGSCGHGLNNQNVKIKYGNWKIYLSKVPCYAKDKNNLKGLLQCKIFIEKSDKTLPENANKKISVFCDAYIPRNRGLNIKFLPVRKSIIRRIIKTN